MNRVFRKFVRLLVTVFIEELNIMTMKDDLLAAVADVSAKIDTVLANESADAAAVATAQAAQKAAEDAAAQATADKDAAVAALADAQANAVDQATIDSVRALGDKLVPPVAPVEDPAV